MTQASQIIAATRRWIETVIVKYNFCPFARKELERHSIRYSISDSVSFKAITAMVLEECIHLDNNPDTATTLLIIPEGCDDFECYLDLVDSIQSKIIDRRYEGIYQLASFHPQYCFADSDEEDAANYTNRAPYPTIHLIREADITQALADYPQPEQIPEKNIALTRRKGKQQMAALLAACLHSSNI